METNTKPCPFSPLGEKVAEGRMRGWFSLVCTKGMLRLGPAASALPLTIVLAFLICSIVSLDKLVAQETMQEINPRMIDAIEIDPEKVADNGLRIIQGQHVTIYTDVPSRNAIEELPEIFDAAVPQWCEYFSVPEKRTKPWKMKVFLIRDKTRFEKAGLVPADLPDFPAGINRGHEIWFFVQPDDYYTRHLLLHEGTHAFMQWFGSGVGASWYAEGMAELLGLHQWKDKTLKIGHRISAATESEGWGRPKLIKNWVAANRAGKKDKALRDVLLTPSRAFAEVENYAWCWAACEFLGQHPLSKDRFGELQKHVHRSPRRFNEEFQKIFAEDLAVLERDWAWFIRELDYGSSVTRGALSELSTGEDKHELKTDRSWQYLEQEVEAGQKFRISAEGRFEIGSSQIGGRIKPWPCEASGITIEWFRGRPIGELQAMVVPADKKVAVLSRICSREPISVGKGGVIVADTDGILCFRVNESPANLSDNRGSLKLAIEKID